MLSMSGKYLICICHVLRAIADWWLMQRSYEKFFLGANDKFEVQRGLNNVFAYDLVPSVKVCEAALRACRRGTVLVPMHRSRLRYHSLGSVHRSPVRDG